MFWRKGLLVLTHITSLNTPTHHTSFGSPKQIFSPWIRRLYLLFHSVHTQWSTLNYVNALLLEFCSYNNFSVFIALQSIALSYRQELAIVFLSTTRPPFWEGKWFYLTNSKSIAIPILMTPSSRLGRGCTSTGYRIKASPKRINERPLSIVPWDFKGAICFLACHILALQSQVI